MPIVIKWSSILLHLYNAATLLYFEHKHYWINYPMDEVKTTTEQKTNHPKSKKLIILALIVVLLAAGGATAYYLFKTDPPAEQAQQDSEESDQTSEEALSEEQTAEIKTRYEATKKAIAEYSGQSNTPQRTSLYASAAFDGAVLRDPEAKAFAAEVLKGYSSDSAANQTEEVKKYVEILTNIANGNYLLAAPAEESQTGDNSAETE